MKIIVVKCALLIMSRGRITCTDGLELPRTLSAIEITAGCTYLGLLQDSTIEQGKLKE